MRVIVVIFAVFHTAVAMAAQLALAWEPSVDPTVTGYAVYIGDAPGSYQQRIDVGASTNAVLTNLTGGTRCYFAVRNYNAANIESLPSNEVSYLIPGALYLSGSAAAGVRLNFVGEQNKTYQVQASTNLINWSVIKVLQPPSNSWVYWDDPDSGSLDQRYYRVLTGP